METKFIPNRNLGKILLTIMIILIVQFVLSGCARNYAQFVRDSELTNTFESAQVLSDYRYYYYGPTFEPDVILGVHRNYELDVGLWKEVNLTNEHLYNWIDQIKSNSNADFIYTEYGSYIVGGEGEKLGIWYSRWPWTNVEKGVNNKLIVYTPDTTDFRLNRKGDSDFLGSHF